MRRALIALTTLALLALAATRLGDLTRLAMPCPAVLAVVKVSPIRP
jgi:hypothetical protein